MALGNRSYRFEEIDPEVSRIAWELAAAIAAEFGITSSEAVAVPTFDMSRALLPD
ncbi:hypothetical protein [Natronococcus sp.]|uniref:hypothetical protein n=1 Tax=Natronococcus sp. TaxID=35747 RepID=UPI003A4E43B2